MNWAGAYAGPYAGSLTHGPVVRFIKATCPAVVVVQVVYVVAVERCSMSRDPSVDKVHPQSTRLSAHWGPLIFGGIEQWKHWKLDGPFNVQNTYCLLYVVASKDRNPVDTLCILSKMPQEMARKWRRS